MTCAMDESAGDFSATPDGCNYCDSARAAARVAKSRNGNFDSLVVDVKNAARVAIMIGVIGVSGGVDSSYVSLHGKKSRS